MNPISTSRDSSRPLESPPPREGLYDPAFERDSCGVGFVASIAGGKRLFGKFSQENEGIESVGSANASRNLGDSGSNAFDPENATDAISLFSTLTFRIASKLDWCRFQRRPLS